MKKLRLLAGLVCAVAVAGCAGTTKSGNPQVLASPDKVSAMLADAADRAANALQSLAAIEQHQAPSAEDAPLTNVPPELRRAVTISWTGPAEPLLTSLADRAGYVFLTFGNPPPVSLVVSVNRENAPVVEVMKDVGLQLGARGTLRVNAEERTVELSYAPVQGAGGRASP